MFSDHLCVFSPFSYVWWGFPMVSPVSAVEIRTDSSGLDASVVHSLAAYARASKFRRTCLQVMAWSLSNSEMAKVREAFMEPWMVGWGGLVGDGWMAMAGGRGGTDMAIYQL
jgi:hypothetical protein